MHMRSWIKDNKLFDGHSNPEQRLKLWMTLSSSKKRLPRPIKK